jgi:RNA polymerase sigma-70 factor (ECF subfamily)
LYDVQKGLTMTGSKEEALTRWLLSHRKALFAYIYAIVRDHALAEDVFQDASIIILKRHDLVDSPTLWGFARGVAKNQAFSSLRSKKKQLLLLSPDAMDCVDRGFDQVADQTEARVEALENCVKVLPENWHEIVRLRYWSNLSVREIAERLQQTENTLSVTLNRIRSRLAKCVSYRLEKVNAP